LNRPDRHRRNCSGRGIFPIDGDFAAAYFLPKNHGPVPLAGWCWLSPPHSARDLAILFLAVHPVVSDSHDLLIDLLRDRASRTDPRPNPHPAPCAPRLASSPF
jgi:hypothetical protein